MLLTPVFATEVATLESMKTTELILVMTDETLQAQVEKTYLVQTCRHRLSVNGSLKEYYFPNSCRAEITKFLMNNGYKADQLSRTFTK